MTTEVEALILLAQEGAQRPEEVEAAATASQQWADESSLASCRMR